MGWIFGYVTNNDELTEQQVVGDIQDALQNRGSFQMHEKQS